MIASRALVISLGKSVWAFCTPLGVSGGNKHGVLPRCKWKGVYPVEAFTVDMRLNLTRGSAATHPCVRLLHLFVGEFAGEQFVTVGYYA